jgi:mannosylglycerate hydrolase
MTSLPPSNRFTYLHTHWDREWYLPFRQYQIRLAQVVDQILADLEAQRYPCFCLDGQTVLLEDYVAVRPEQVGRLRQLIASSQLTVGPWYVAPDSYLVGAESLVRNLQRGLAMSAAWGCHQFCGYLPDTFGHSQDMPTILAGFGLTNAMAWRGINPDLIQQQPAFWWQSPTGDRVLTWHLAEGYFQNALHDPHMTLTQQQEAFERLLNNLPPKSPTDIALIPLGGDHLGPLPAENLPLLRQHHLMVTTPDVFMAQLQARAETTALPTLQGELLDNTTAFVLPGVYSARLDLKQANKRLEHRLTRITEPLLALQQAIKPSSVYPAAALDIAWQQLLLNHPHDSICGCSIDAVHRENHVRYAQVAQICESLERLALNDLANALGDSPALPPSEAAPSTSSWLMTNLGSQSYTGVVSLTAVNPENPSLGLPQVIDAAEVLQDAFWTDICDVPMAHRTQTNVQGVGFVQNLSPMAPTKVALADLTLPPEIPPVSWEAETQTLRNGYFKIVILANGDLSVTHLPSGQTYGPWLRFWDAPDQGDSYNCGPVPGQPAQCAALLQVELLVQGPLLSTIRLIHTFANVGGHPWQIETDVTLAAGRPWIALETRYTNLTPAHKLQVRFETGAPVHKVQAESHLSVTTRHYENPDLAHADLMPVAPFKELPLVTGSLQRFVCANGQVVMTEGLTEYEVLGSQLGITLLRAFGMLSKADTGVRGAQAGPPLPTPDGQRLHIAQSFRYAWMPEPESVSQVYEATEAFYGTVLTQPLATKPRSEIPSSWLTWENASVRVLAFLWQPKTQQLPAGWVLRLLNTSTATQSVTLTGRLIDALFSGNLQDALRQGSPQGLCQLNLAHEPLADKPVLTAPRLVLPALGVMTLHIPRGLD